MRKRLIFVGLLILALFQFIDHFSSKIKLQVKSLSLKIPFFCFKKKKITKILHIRSFSIDQLVRIEPKEKESTGDNCR